MSRRVSRTAPQFTPEGLDVVVRPAGPSDLPAVIAIECDAFSDPWPDSAFREAIAADHMHFVVATTTAGAVVAYLIGWFAGGDGEIANIAVAADARGHGIGGRLLDEALALAWQRGSATVHLETELSGVHTFTWESRRNFHEPGSSEMYVRSSWQQEGAIC